MTGFFEKYGRSLIRNGYGIVPIPKGGKSPALRVYKDDGTHEGFAWSLDYARTEAQFDEMLGRDWGKHGVGIVTKTAPAIDIDVLDADLVDDLVAFIEKNHGELPTRIGKAPKKLLMFRMDKPVGKMVSGGFMNPEHPEWTPDRKWMRVEILADGQQFVAFHIHPDTGKPYEWTDEFETPDLRPVSSLPLLTVDDLKAICSEFERLAIERGWEQKTQASQASASEQIDADYDPFLDLPPPEETTFEVERVKQAIEVLKLHISDMDYDQWLNLMFALKWTQWDCSYDLAKELSEASDKHTDDHFERTWNGADKRQRNKKVTLASLYESAKRNGWDATREKTAEQEVADTKKMMTMVSSLVGMEEGEERDDFLETLFKEMAAAQLNPLNADKVLQAIKKHTGISLGTLRRQLKDSADVETGMSTHAAYAQAFILALKKESGVMPVGVEGQIFVYNQFDSVWEGRLASEYEVEVSKQFDGRENCSRRNDYLAICAHAYTLVAKDKSEFFDKAPVGLACGGVFYKVNNDSEIEKEPLGHEHRQRVVFDVMPQVGPMPMFKRFLAQTFAGDTEDEQINLLQEIVGATMLGVLARHEKVVMMKGEGRAGKGTLMKIIESMLPRESTSALSPFRWDSEYYVAALAGKRLNVVGELPDDKPIPAAEFKTVTGRDLLTGRHPTGRPFTFRNEATHIFNSNYYVFTKDHSEAFYGRWIMLEFRNSLIHHEDKQDRDLAKKIIEDELPAVMAWGLQGAKRMLKRGFFTPTANHRKLMLEWQRRTSTLLEFLQDTDVCVMGQGKEFVTVRSFFYKSYSEWCKSGNRKPMGKQRLYDEIRTNLVSGLGIHMGTVANGTDAVRGVRIRSFDEGAFSEKTGSELEDEDPL